MSTQLVLEALETRWTPCTGHGLAESADGVAARFAAAASDIGPEVRLRLVVLHEFGHALGLAHASDPNSIMHPFYNPEYNLNTFGDDPAVADLRLLYDSAEDTPWKNAADLFPGNNKIDITFSFIRDDSLLEHGQRSDLISTFDRLYGDRTRWMSIFTDELARWSHASGGRVRFLPFDGDDAIEDDKQGFGFAGQVQNEPRAGDIRIGGRNLDGPARVLARTYYPPPTNQDTRAGDTLFDTSENWDGRQEGLVQRLALPSDASITASMVLAHRPRSTERFLVPAPSPGASLLQPEEHQPAAAREAEPSLSPESTRRNMAADYHTVRFQSDTAQQLAESLGDGETHEGEWNSSVVWPDESHGSEPCLP